MRVSSLTMATVLALGLTLPPGASAQESQIGIATICDTPEQLEHFVKVYSETGSARIAQLHVNAQARSNACITMGVAYLRQEPIRRVQTPQGPAMIHKILVVGITDDGETVEKLAHPETQYTLYRIPEQDA